MGLIAQVDLKLQSVGAGRQTTRTNVPDSFLIDPASGSRCLSPYGCRPLREWAEDLRRPERLRTTADPRGGGSPSRDEHVAGLRDYATASGHY
jgi:hypothetical protein